MNVLTLAWRNVGRNRRRSVLSITAIAVATLAIVVLFSLIEGMKRDMEYNLTTFYTGEIQIRNPEYGAYEHLHPLHLSVDDADDVVATTSSIPGVDATVARITVPGAVFDETKRIGVQAIGVDMEREERFSDLSTYIVAESDDPPPERVVPVVVGNGIPDRLDVDLGDTFTVVARTALRGTNAMTFSVAAVADFPVTGLNATAFWAPIDEIRRLARMPEQAMEILVKLDDSRAAEAVQREISAALPTLEVRRFEEIETTYSFMELASAVYNVIALFFFLLASTVIVNTTMMVVFERRQEIGTLEAIGMSGGELVRIFFIEALILGALGAAVGLVGGIGVTAVLGRVGIDFSSAMEGVDFEMSPVLYPVLNLRSTVGAFFFAVVVSGVTSYIPTRRITRIEPVEALREE